MKKKEGDLVKNFENNQETNQETNHSCGIDLTFI